VGCRVRGCYIFDGTVNFPRNPPPFPFDETVKFTRKPIAVYKAPTNAMLTCSAGQE
jgi:hypothetical protein